ncbi:MAG TPA: hypothetical protein VF986_07165 [Actinomycetota bacterium]
MSSQGTNPGTRWARRIGFSVGLVLVAVALNWWRVPPGTDPLLGAEVAFTAGPTGELAVSPAGRFLAGTDLRPSGRILIGTLQVGNQTGRNLAVQLRALPDLDDLDHLLQVEISYPQQVLFRGDLGGLRTWTAPLILRRGREQALEFRAWLLPQAPSGYEGDVASVTMEFLAEPVGG